MVTIKKLKAIAKKNGKKLSKNAINIINNSLEQKAKEIIKKATKNADFEGRITIKEKDIKNQ